MAGFGRSGKASWRRRKRRTIVGATYILLDELRVSHAGSRDELIGVEVHQAVAGLCGEGGRARAEGAKPVAVTGATGAFPNILARGFRFGILYFGEMVNVVFILGSRESWGSTEGLTGFQEVLVL